MLLSRDLKGRKAILNVRNFNDHKCLLRSILPHQMNLNYDKQVQTFEHTLNIQGVTYSVAFTQIPKIEEQNNIRIKVFGYEDGEIYILHVSKKTNIGVINLLLISDGENFYYTLIRDYSRFMSFYCYRCLLDLFEKISWRNISPYCSRQSTQIIKMPKEGEKILSFTGVHLQETVPYIIC